MKTLDLLTAVSDDILAIKELEGPARIEVERVMGEYIAAANSHLEEEHRKFINGERPIYEAIAEAKGHDPAEALPDYSVPFTPLAESKEVIEFEDIKHAYLYGLHAFGLHASHISTTPEHKYWSVTTIVRKHRKVEQVLNCNIDDSVSFRNNPYHGPVYDVARLNAKLKELVKEMGLEVFEIKSNKEMLEDMVEHTLGDWIFEGGKTPEMSYDIDVQEGNLQYRITFLLLANPVTNNYDRRSKAKVLIDNEVATSDRYLIARYAGSAARYFRGELQKK